MQATKNIPTILGLAFLIFSSLLCLYEFVSFLQTTFSVKEEETCSSENTNNNKNELEMSSARPSTDSSNTAVDADKTQRRAARESEALKTGELITRKEATNRKVVAGVVFAATGLTYAIKGASLISTAWWSVPLTMACATGLTGQKAV